MKHMTGELGNVHGVLAGAGFVEKEEVGMGGGNGSLILETGWLDTAVFCPQIIYIYII